MCNLNPTHTHTHIYIYIISLLINKEEQHLSSIAQQWQHEESACYNIFFFKKKPMNNSKFSKDVYKTITISPNPTKNALHRTFAKLKQIYHSTEVKPKFKVSTHSLESHSTIIF